MSSIWTREYKNAYSRIYNKQYRQKIGKQKHNEYRTIERLRFRKEVFNAYGNICGCCSEDRYEFLCIDHINGRGYKPKNKKGLRITGVSFYRYLRKHNYPRDDYRLLCHNCNQSIGYYGYCPHQKGGELVLESSSN